MTQTDGGKRASVHGLVEEAWEEDHSTRNQHGENETGADGSDLSAPLEKSLSLEQNSERPPRVRGVNGAVVHLLG